MSCATTMRRLGLQLQVLRWLQRHVPGEKGRIRIRSQINWETIPLTVLCRRSQYLRIPRLPSLPIRLLSRSVRPPVTPVSPCHDRIMTLSTHLTWLFCTISSWPWLLHWQMTAAVLSNGVLNYRRLFLHQTVRCTPCSLYQPSIWRGSDPWNAMSV